MLLFLEVCLDFWEINWFLCSPKTWGLCPGLLEFEMLQNSEKVVGKKVENATCISKSEQTGAGKAALLRTMPINVLSCLQVFLCQLPGLPCNLEPQLMGRDSASAFP